MIHTVVNSDSVSEKHRKYVYDIKWSKQYFFFAEGADLTIFNQDDKFLIDKDGRILLFKVILSLVNYIKEGNYVAFDQDNFKEWARDYTSEAAYTSYDLDHITDIISHPISLENISQDEIIELLNFINLFGDYAFQREQEDEYFLTLHDQKEVRTFFDFAYDNYVWDNPEHAGFRSLNELDYLRFDEEQFRATIQQMLRTFMDNAVVWEG